MRESCRQLQQSQRGKRQLEDEEDGGEGEMEVEEGGRGGGPENKRAREEGSLPGGGANGEGRSGGQPDLNFPLPNETGLPCLLKVPFALHSMAYKVLAGFNCKRLIENCCLQASNYKFCEITYLSAA